MCEQVGLTVLRLKRVAIGDLELEDLKKGTWRYLGYEEVRYLKESCGLEVSRDAGN
jgi:23S rRNA pseudouridine2605 synthase